MGATLVDTDLDHVDRRVLITTHTVVQPQQEGTKYPVIAQITIPGGKIRINEPVFVKICTFTRN